MMRRSTRSAVCRACASPVLLFRLATRSLRGSWSPDLPHAQGSVLDARGPQRAQAARHHGRRCLPVLLADSRRTLRTSHAMRQLGLSEAAECLVACNTLPGWPSPAAQGAPEQLVVMAGAAGGQLRQRRVGQRRVGAKVGVQPRPGRPRGAAVLRQVGRVDVGLAGGAARVVERHVAQVGLTERHAGALRPGHLRGARAPGVKGSVRGAQALQSCVCKLAALSKVYGSHMCYSAMRLWPSASYSLIASGL